MTDKVIVYTTCSNAADAEKLARHLIEQRVAACVNVIPGVASYYRWKGEVHNDAEVVLMIKSGRGLVDALRSELEKQHIYELPEMVVVPIVDGSANYLNWLENEIRPERESGT